MSVRQLTEHVQQQRGGIRVDRERGILGPVKVLGWSSSNGRSYASAGVDPGLYEKKRVVAGHTPSGKEPSPHDVIGWLEGCSKKSSGVYAERLCLLDPSGPLERRIMSAATNADWLFGLSHEARGRTRQGPSGLIVEQLEAVSAVALVVEPATTRGLGESRGWSGSRLGVRFLAETVPSRNLGRWLAGGGMSRATEHALARMRTLVERLGRSDRRKAALLLEVAEAGLLGDADGDGEITSGIGSPPTAEVARRSRLVKAIKRILMDQTLVFDDALGQAIALLDDPDSIDDDDDAEDMDAEESRQGRPHVSYAMVNAQIKAAAIVQRQLRESHQGRARPPAPSEPAALGRWLTGRL